MGLPVCTPSVAEAEGISGLRSAVRNLTRPVMEAVRTVIRPTLRVVQHEAGPVIELQIDETQRFLLTVLGDGTARLWDLQRGVQLGGALGRQITAATVRGEGAGLETVAVRGDGAWISMRPDGVLRKRHGEINGGTSIAMPMLSADGSTVVYRSDAGRAWHVGRHGLRQSKKLPEADPGARPILSANGSTIAYRTVRGTMVVTSGSAAGSAKLMELEGCKDTIPITAGTFSVDGKQAIFGDDKGSLCVWSVSGPDAPQRLFVREKAHTGAIRLIVADQAGRHVGVGGNDGSVGVWATSAGLRLVASLKPDKAFLGPLLLDVGRGWILAGEPRGAVAIYSIDTKRLIAHLISTDLGWAVLDSKGRFDGPQDGVDALVWAGDTTAETLPVDAFSASYFEPGLLAKLGDRLQPFLNEDIRDLSEDGYVAPPAVSIDPIDNRPADPEGRSMVRIRLDPSYPRRDVLAVRLYHNGKLVHSDAMISSDVDEFVDYVLRLLPGVNTFRAVGVGPGGIEGPPAVATAEVEAVEPLSAGMQVVAIGIGDYVRPDWKLEYTRNDAGAVVAALREQGSRLYRDVNVVTLLDSTAKAITIEEHISRKSRSPNDVLVVFFAGHGYALPAEDGNWEWYLMPYTHAWSTGASDIDDMIRQHGISSHRLLHALTKAQAQRIFLILDSCRSGAVIETVAAIAGRMLDDAVGQKTLRQVARVGGIHVLAASRANEDAIELLSVPHGALTYLVLEGIRGAADGNRNGKVSVGEIIGYATREMPLLSQRLVKETISQKPVGYSRGTDFELTGG